MIYGMILGALLAAPSVMAQQPASQRALNGFVLGQHKETVTNTFTELLQEGTAANGQTYNAFSLDPEHRAYMVFQYSVNRPDYLYSIQVTGDPGTNMRPFLGLRLGDPKADVLSQLGNPTSVDPIPEAHVERLEYGPERNFSVEIDSLGRVFSIRIMANRGFEDQPSFGDVPSMDDVKELLADSDPDALLGVLAADVEVFRGAAVYSFERAARLDLADSTSRMAQELFAGPGSLRKVLTSKVIRGAESSVRVYDDSSRYPNVVYAFSDDGPLVEIVFTADSGAWRIWEVSFR